MLRPTDLRDDVIPYIFNTITSFPYKMYRAILVLGRNVAPLRNVARAETCTRTRKSSIDSASRAAIAFLPGCRGRSQSLEVGDRVYVSLGVHCVER